MYQKKVPVSLNCGLDLFKEILNGKWKTTLLYYICTGVKRPGQLQRMIPEADRRVLDKHLGELTGHGLISKTIFSTLPPKVEYDITPLGESLLPVICHMHQWGEDHSEELKQLMNIDVKK